MVQTIEVKMLIVFVVNQIQPLSNKNLCNVTALTMTLYLATDMSLIGVSAPYLFHLAKSKSLPNGTYKDL